MKLVQAIGLSLLAAGVTTGGVISASQINAPVQESKEVAASDTVTIYLDCTNWGIVSNVKYYAWGWGSGVAGDWYDFTLLSGNIYSVEVPSGVTSFDFLRARNDMSHGWTEGTNYWNRTDDTSRQAFQNYFKIDGYSYGTWKSSNYYASGTKLYVGVEGSDTINWWFGKDAGVDTYCFLDIILNDNHTAYQMTRVGTSNVAYYSFSSNTFVDMIIIVRGKAGFPSGPDWSKKVNQSTDISLGATNTGCNAIKLGNLNGEGKATCEGFEEFSKDFVSKEWSHYFLNETSTYCTASVTTTSIIKSNYDAMMTLASGADANFYNAPVLRAKTGHVSKESEAISRYANMQEDKGYSDFLNLGEHNPKGKRAYLIPAVDSIVDNSGVIIIAVASIALVAAGGYFFIKRRKEN